VERPEDSNPPTPSLWLVNRGFFSLLVVRCWCWLPSF
jgi:hypothetical protein